MGKVGLKLGLSALAIYFVYTRIDVSQAVQLISTAHPGWLLGAILAFVGSQLLSAFRLNYHFQAIDCRLDTWVNVRLYLLGMFYNLFLPGGIGGDGYKAWWMNREREISVKSLVTALLLDRINGLIALLVLISLGALVVRPQIGVKYEYLMIPGLMLIYPTYYWVLRRFFRRFTFVVLPTSLLSLSIQGAQLFCMCLLLFALREHSDFLAYGLLFLLSSIAAVFPLSIGGLGARELVFLWGSTYLGLQTETAVAMSLLFYLITAGVSFLGGYYAWMPERLKSKA